MIELKYFTKEDFSQLINWVNDPAFLMQWAGPGFTFPLDKKQLKKYIKHANQPNSDTRIYKVIDQETNEAIGHISLALIDRNNKSARIARVLIGEQRARGKGIGELMIEKVLRIAFDKLHLHRVSLGVFDFNTSAIACYEKAGFIKEGLSRDSRRFENEYWSLLEMSILREEWIDRKK